MLVAARSYLKDAHLLDRAEIPVLPLLLQCQIAGFYWLNTNKLHAYTLEA